MKVFNAKAIGVTKKFAAKAAMYRRAARKMGDKKLSYTKEDLVELYAFESRGEGTRDFYAMRQTNGFALGKWLRDIDIAQIREDMQNGLFLPIEFLGLEGLGFIHNKEVANFTNPRRFIENWRKDYNPDRTEIDIIWPRPKQAA